MKNAITITTFGADEMASHATELGALLQACVEAGASVGFVLPFTAADGALFWTDKILPALRHGRLLMLVARQNGRIAGTVLLDHDTPPNQPHRAEVRKLLVHPDYRRQGIALALMKQLEQQAGQLERSLLTLDTRSGDPAEALYAALGYRTSGQIPGYCRDPRTGLLDATTIMYKTRVAS